VNYTSQLWLFFVLVFGAVILPGLDMALILGSALTGGRHNGFAAVAGAIAGAACHSVIVALGIGVLLKIPGTFNTVLIAGTAYIAWIGVSTLRSSAPATLANQAAPISAWVAFRRGLANNMMNPNAYLFSLAIFPQFIRPEYGTIALQAFVLWAIIALTQAGVYGSVVLAAAQVRQGLATKPWADAMLRRLVGSMLIAIAIWVGFESWRRL